MSITDLPAVAAAADPGSPTEPASPTPKRGRRGLFLSYLLTVFVLVTANFFLPRTLPGDPVTTAIGTSGATEEEKARLTEYYGLDRPLLTQYGSYLADLAQGDLGRSMRPGSRPVRSLVLEGAKWTLLLVGAGTLIATAVGGVAGIHAGWRRGGRADRRLLGALVVVGNFPVYVIAALALLVFSVKLGWAPLAGAQEQFTDMGMLERALDIAHHLALPATVMALQFVFLTFLITRGSMVGELGSDYLLIGRAKGLADRRLKYRYAARNALLPVVTVVALNFGTAVGGSIFVERVFAYPGLGRVMFEAIAVRDYTAMQGAFLALSLVVVTVNLLADLLYPRLDPRVST